MFINIMTSTAYVPGGSEGTGIDFETFDTGYDDENANEYFDVGKMFGEIVEEKIEKIDDGHELELSQSEILLRDWMRQEGFGDHHIKVFDNWISGSAHANIYGKMLKFRDSRVVCFENLKILQPRYTRDSKVLPLTPKMAREQGVTYGCDWHVDVVLRKDNCNGEELDRRTGICIGTVPVMLKSRNCYLHKKSARELALMGEDPKDPGGYFVVAGVEKVVLLQEQLSVNKIFLMKMQAKEPTVARLTANTVKGTALIELALDKKTQKLVKIRLPSMKMSKPGAKKPEKYKSINVLRIFRIYGIKTLQEIKDLIGLFIKPEYVKKSLLKLTRNYVDFEILKDDIKIITDKMDKSKLSENDKIAEVKRILDNDLFPHLKDLPGPDNETVKDREDRIAQGKIYLLAIMVARYIEHLAGFRPLDDRDKWGNKRLEGGGRMKEQLLRNAWRKIIGIAQAAIESGSVKDLSGVVEKLRSSVITDTFHDSFITSHWGVKGSKAKNNVAQTLVRDSVVATFAHINTVDVRISRTDRQPNLRLVQNSQWGFIDATSTPEGENAGIVKNLSITAKVSLNRSDRDIIRFLIGDEAKQFKQRVFLDPSLREEYPDKLIANGKFLGWCNGEETRNFLISLRRDGTLPFDMSVIQEEDWLYIDIGPSRLVRPLLIVSPNQRLAIDELGLRGKSNHTLVTSGAVEYISAWEQEYIKLATSVDVIEERLRNIESAKESYRMALADRDAIISGVDIEVDDNDGNKVIMTLDEAERRVIDEKEALDKISKTLPYTHCELDPQAVLGVAANLIIWPEHNPAPRNTYQVGMSKQALGIFHANHLNRMGDVKTKILAFPNRPVVESLMYNIIGLDERGPGENIETCFFPFPFTEEDSFAVKKEFLDNGGFRIIRYLTYKTIVKRAGDVAEHLARPERMPGEPENRYKYIQQAEPDSPLNGLPSLGAILRQGDCVIGKIQQISITKEIRNESVFLRVGDEGIVEKVQVSSDGKTIYVTVKLRIMRVPEEGDKFAPRNAQKGTVGIVVSDIDMPMTKQGIIPDIIVNPHCIPSRMTMSYLMELLASKHGAMRGIHVNGGPHKPFEFSKYRNTMLEYGLHQFGYEKMRSGTSGKDLVDDEIYCGPVFFQALKHHVKDKYQARGTGQVKPMTRQPPKGRGSAGGLRFGEMERDAIISHGASSFLRERLMLVSDGYQTAYCKTCGTFAIFDENTKSYKRCRMCKDLNPGKCTTPYSYKLLIHLLAAAGIKLSPEFMTSQEYMDKIFAREHGTLGDYTLDDIRNQLLEADQPLGDEIEADEMDLVDTDFAEVY